MTLLVTKIDGFYWVRSTGGKKAEVCGYNRKACIDRCMQELKFQGVTRKSILVVDHILLATAV